jgi:1-acyl-sn-glycerol-3-phosphate acyltransferase
MSRKKLTIQQKLEKRKLRRPPKSVYWTVGGLWRLAFMKRLNVHYEYRVNPRDYRKGAYFVVSNHVSRLDYFFAGSAFFPERLNYLAGYNEFFRSHLALVFRAFQAIPKRNFAADMYAIREISRLIKKGGKVIIFPEGMNSIGGSNQPCALGSGGLLKHYGVPVLMTKIKGGYLTSPKFCLDERPGRVDVVVDLLFTPEDLARMSADEVQAKLDLALRHDDYEWNKVERVRYRGRGRLAENMHQILYWCPKCRSEFTMRGEGDSIRCVKCGNGATLNEYYDLTPLDAACSIPPTPRVWYDLERGEIRRQVSGNEAFELRERVRLGVLPRHGLLRQKKTSEIVGEGELVLDRTGLTYTGTREGDAFGFHLNPDLVPTYGMCTDVSRFYTFFKGEFFEFFPEAESVAKWLFATEEIHRITGGRWKDFPDCAGGQAPARDGA